ncbi:tetratricopeptide repeat protein [candidate division KSB1 bacterium]|nr:tetratricopeptide repeat protein [candidate division KSB1 bacterium]
MHYFDENPAGEREIRVFISSTFMDMQAERDYLVKFIFPRMRNLCEKKGVIWGEVDLRWGVHITEEEINEGKVEQKVLKSCLDEIQRNHTIFIGILGERYGWIPENIPDDLIAGLGLEPLHGKSVTELEIIYGVLRNPGISKNAFFYFRHPDFTASRLSDEGCHPSNFFELPRPDEIEEFGMEIANKRSEIRKDNLKVLKDRIREYAKQGNCRLFDEFISEEKLGEQIARDIEGVVGRLFPADEKLDAFEQHDHNHTNYAIRFTKFYYPHITNFETLTRFINQSKNNSLVITGTAGAGKTALLANWFLRFQNENKDYWYLTHFVGANDQSTDWEHLLRRFIKTLQQFLYISEPIPEDKHDLRVAFVNWLNIAAVRKKIIILIDAVNQLTDRNGALDLVWLPEFIPANVKIIISTLPGKSHEELKRRNWQFFQLQSLEKTDIDLFTIQFLKQLYGKELDKQNREKIRQSQQTNNPLFLTLLLDELRQIGDAETISQKLNEYLMAPDIPVLFEKIIERYQEDYEKESPGLVKNAFSFIYASRSGLSESELLEILGTEDGKPLPAIYWSPLYLAAEYSLIDKSGILTFSHDYLRQAIRNRFLSTPEQEKEVHEKLANYFKNRPTTFRKIEEYPWHLWKIASWHSLAHLLSSEEFFSDLWNYNANDMKFYWHEIEKSSPIKFIEQNRKVFKNPGDYSLNFVNNLADLSFDNGHFIETSKLRTFLVQYYKKEKDDSNWQHQLRLLANTEFMMGNHQSALKKYKIQAEICIRTNNKEGLQNSYGNQAVMLRYQKNYREALNLLHQQEAICQEIKDQRGLLRCYGNMANIYKLQKKYQEALAFHHKEEQIIKEFGDQKMLQIAFGNQALVYRTLHDYQKALALHEQEKEICERLGDTYGLQAAMGNMGHIYFEQQSYPEALTYYQLQLHIAQSIPHPWGEQNAHYNIAMAHIQTNDWKIAKEHLEKANDICKKHAFENEAKMSLNMLHRIKRMVKD